MGISVALPVVKRRPVPCGWAEMVQLRLLIELQQLGASAGVDTQHPWARLGCLCQ